MIAQLAQGGQARRHGQGIARQRSSLENGTGRHHPGHDVCTAAKGAHGQAAAYDFAKHGQVWRLLKKLLSAAIGETEARHHFVENQQGAVFFGLLAKRGQEAALRANEPHVARDRLHNHAGDLVPFFLKRLFQGGCVLKLRIGVVRTAARIPGLFGTPSVVGSSRPAQQTVECP